MTNFPLVLVRKVEFGVRVAVRTNIDWLIVLAYLHINNIHIEVHVGALYILFLIFLIVHSAEDRKKYLI